VRPVDTSAEAERIQWDRYAAMTPIDRIEIAWELSPAVREVATDGIPARHPEYDEAQVRHALNRLILGDALFRAAWPDAPALTP